MDKATTAFGTKASTIWTILEEFCWAYINYFKFYNVNGMEDTREPLGVYIVDFLGSVGSFPGSRVQRVLVFSRMENRYR